MKRLGRIWPAVISFENLLSAYHKARKGKQSVAAVATFSLNLEAELLSLQQELTDFTYQPGRYRLFTIYERKKRQISAGPFRDRVVHHALINIIEPSIDRRFIFDSYARLLSRSALIETRVLGAQGYRSVSAGVHGIAFRPVRMMRPNSLRREAVKRGE